MAAEGKLRSLNSSWKNRKNKLNYPGSGALPTRGFKDGLQPETLADGTPYSNLETKTH